MDSHAYSYYNQHHHHPTPPYYSTNHAAAAAAAAPFVPSSSKHHSSSRHVLASTLQSQHQQQHVPLVINTKLEHQQQQQHPAMRQHYNSNNSVSAPPPSNNIVSDSNSKEQQQTTAQLADFAAHMVCYLLFGHKGSSRNSNESRTTPPSSIPTSPSYHHHKHGHHNHSNTHHHHHPTSPSCPCEICTLTDSSAYRSIHIAQAAGGAPSPLSSSSSLSTSSGYPTWNHQQQQQHGTARPTHRRILSESDIVQPRPMFRKFCLDVLSATLLSPSVILLSLKYIQQLMINLKENNKTPSTGEGSEFRLFTGALILANKFLDDNTFTNRTWANITGISVKEVNYIELQFLQGIHFRLFTRSYDYTEWLASLTHFTGKYMPSQYFVAFQQQTVAALSPISPMDPTTGTTESVLPTPETVAGDLMLSTPPPIMQQERGSAWGSTSTAYAHAHIDQSSYRSEAPTSLSAGAGVPTGVATGSVIPHYANSTAKQVQNRPCSGYRFQRVAPPPVLTTTTTMTTTHSAATTLPSATTYMGSYPGSSAPPSSSSTWSSPSYQQQQHSRYLETPSQSARKRSATIAFDEIMDRSPCYESSGSAAASSASLLNLPTPTTSGSLSHKRVSSSSSMVHMMGELSTGAPSMFQAGYSPVMQTSTRLSNRRSYQHLAQAATATVPSQRVSTGTMPVPFRGQHHRNASGSHCMDVSGYSSFSQEPSHMASVPSQAGRMHPLDQEDRQSFYRSSPSYYVPSQQHSYSALHNHQQQQASAMGGYYDYSAAAAAASARTPPYYSSPSRDYHYQRSSGTNNHFYAPSSSMEYRDIDMRGMATAVASGRSSPYYEMDPRFWGPLDNLSLYAMTTQAAKRVFVQSKALAASTNGLSAYYPTTPA